MEKASGAGSAADITALLRAWSAGDRDALEQLTPIVYKELKRSAKRYMMRERKEHSLQPTALVNEAFLRLMEVHGVQWQDRNHFFAFSAQMMRRILVNYALARGAGKRGGSVRQVSIEDAMIGSLTTPITPENGRSTFRNSRLRQPGTLPGKKFKSPREGDGIRAGGSTGKNSSISRRTLTTIF